MYLTLIGKCYWWNQQELISPKSLIDWWSIHFRFLASVNRPFSAFKKCLWQDLNTNMGGLFRGLFQGGDGWISPCVKLVRIMLETWNLVHKYTHIYSFRKKNFWYQGLLNFGNTSIFFFCKKSVFFAQSSTFTQSNSVRAVLEFFYFCFQFL